MPEALLRKVLAVQVPPQRLSNCASAVCSTSRSFLQAIGDEVADRADPEVVELGEGEEIVHPRHRAVLAT